jgi:hypothetical protein
MVARGTTVVLPDAWQVRTKDEFDTFLDAFAEVPGVDPAFASLLAADIRPVIRAAESEGLVLLAGILEPIGPIPDPLVPPDLTVPFDADDIEVTAISATLALFERERPTGTIDDLLRVASRTAGRWLARPSVVDLPVGPAVLTREVQAVHPASLKRASDVLVNTYYVLPDDEPESILVALFRTPSLQFATEFEEQFAAIAARIRTSGASE